MAGLGLTVPSMLPSENLPLIYICIGVCVKLLRPKLSSKAQKHYEIKTFGESKLTLKAPITTAADGIHKYFFIVFQRK